MWWVPSINSWTKINCAECPLLADSGRLFSMHNWTRVLQTYAIQLRMISRKNALLALKSSMSLKTIVARSRASHFKSRSGSSIGMPLGATSLTFAPSRTAPRYTFSGCKWVCLLFADNEDQLQSKPLTQA